MPSPEKLSYDDLVGGMSPFLQFDTVERDLKAEKERRLKAATEALVNLSTQDSGGVDDIMEILNVKSVYDFKCRLQMILATTVAGAIETLDRVCMVICPGHRTWSQRCKSETAKRAIADFLIYPEGTVGIPCYIRERFKLHKSWLTMMRVDLPNSIHGQLQSWYNTHIGFALESLVGKIVTECGYVHTKGLVECVDNKEVDIVVPDVYEPRILIMSTYFITTSSAQSSRAREQRTMYEDVCRYNSQRIRAKYPAVQFVNVVDGGGWIYRNRDSAILHQFCDYMLAESHLREHLPAILDYHMKQTSRA